MAPTSTRPTVVVTGASAGVGRAVVRAFAERGASLALIARGRDGLQAAASELTAAGARAIVDTPRRISEGDNPFEELHDVSS